MMVPITIFFVFLYGLAVGSFLNVLISRLPRGISVVTPRSYCFACGRQLEWWENVPVVSYVVLGGRCRTCRAPIGWRHLAVELATGTIAAVAAWFLLAGAWRDGSAHA